MKTRLRILYFLLLILFFFSSCQTIDLYEKTAAIPGHKWKNSFKPSFTFVIKDTAVPYKIFVTLRHRDKYNYNNIYISLTTRQPGQDSTQTAMYDLKLGNDEEGWKGSGMDDIYEHRIPLTPETTDFYFRKKGNYTFAIEQVMREDPLEHVMNVGLRIEKKQP
ncbi:MAG: gliding motility lipoprotein GldH [Bacteroidota bacterium]